MIGLHTIVLFIIGVVMLAMGLGLDVLLHFDVSGWVQAIAGAFGAYLIGMSYFSLRFDRRRARALETGAPVPAKFEVSRMSDGDAAAYLARVKVQDETWIAPLRMSRRVRRLSKDDELDGEAWLDEEGRLVALAHDGELLRVMPFPRRKKQKKKAT
ncbi:MAG: hypothetical protein R3C00_09650 [Hyphomonas sp.]|nr:hypothetical protein [Hyphomonas sp.]MCB9970848.1 hypothetical protein [Hyphomonas sp.]